MILLHFLLYYSFVFDDINVSFFVNIFKNNNLSRYAEAQEAANYVLQFDNINVDAIYVRGLCLYYEDNVDRAFSHFTQVLRLAPDHLKAKEIYKVMFY